MVQAEEPDGRNEGRAVVAASGNDASEEEAVESAEQSEKIAVLKGHYSVQRGRKRKPEAAIAEETIRRSKEESQSKRT